MGFTAYMDFSPSESFSGAAENPGSPFTAAGCVFMAHPDIKEQVEEEIRHYLRPKTATAKLRALPFLWRKIKAKEMRVYALCLQCTEDDAIANGTVNFIPAREWQFVRGLEEHWLRKFANENAAKIAGEIGADTNRVKRLMALHTLVNRCAIYFLHLFQTVGGMDKQTRGRVEMKLDKLPEGQINDDTLHTINARYRTLNEQLLEKYDAKVVINPTPKSTKEKHCGILLADLFANITTGITDGLSRRDEVFVPDKRKNGLPIYSKEEGQQIGEFSERMMREGFLLHATPGMLEVMVMDFWNTCIMLNRQQDYGLDYPWHLPADFFQRS